MLLCNGSGRERAGPEAMTDRRGEDAMKPSWSAELSARAARVCLCLALAVTACARLHAAGKGALKVGNENIGLEIETAGAKTIVVPPNGGVQLPAGDYPIKSFTLLAKDKNGGKVWKLQCTRPHGPFQSFSIKEGETTTLDVGPPLFLRATVGKPTTQQPTTIQIGLLIQGKGEEIYSPAAKVGTQGVPPPKFKIVAESGKTLAAGQLEYG